MGIAAVRFGAKNAKEKNKVSSLVSEYNDKGMYMYIYRN